MLYGISVIDKSQFLKRKWWLEGNIYPVSSTYSVKKKEKWLLKHRQVFNGAYINVTVKKKEKEE